MIERKVNETFYIKIDTNQDLFDGAEEFTASFLSESLSGSNVEQLSTTFSEILGVVDNHSATLTSTALSGLSVLSVSNSTLTKGDVIDVAGEKFTIDSVNSNTVKIRGKLKCDVSSGSVVTTVGNTGVYRAPVSFDSPGEYLLIVKHPKIGHLALSVLIRDAVTLSKDRYKAFV